MNANDNLLSDLAEVSHELRDWAADLLNEGASASEIIEMLRRAAELSGRA